MKLVVSLVLAVVVTQMNNGADAACGFFNPFGCPGENFSFLSINWIEILFYCQVY